MNWKLIKKVLSISIFVIYLSTLSVHLFDAEFSGKFTVSDNKEFIQKGKKLYASKSCLDCHGDNGENPVENNYPIVSGQPRKYIYQQIIDIRDGNRKNGNSTLMSSTIEGLTDEEAYLISFYLAN